MVPENPGQMRAHIDALHLGTVDGFAAAGGGAVAASWEGTSWLWSALDEPVVLSLTEGPVSAAASTQDGVWVVLDDALYLFDGVLRRVDWADDLGGPVVDLETVGQALYLSTQTGLFRRSEGLLTQLYFDGQTPTAPMALGGTSSGVPVLWIGQSNGVYALDPVSGEVIEGLALDAGADDVAVDASGLLHVLSDGQVQVRQGSEWTVLNVEGAVGLIAEASAEGVWIATATGWMHQGREGQNHVLDVDPTLDADAHIDGLGRLLHTDAAGLWRTAANRPVEVVGLYAGDRVEAPMVVSFVPTAPDDVLNLTARVVRLGDAIDVVVADDWTATIDPLGLVFGNWTLEVDTTFVNEAAGRGEVTLQMAASGGASWFEHIEPIYLQHCSQCHDGATETVLEDLEDWSASIDVILEKVISGEMPLVGSKLSDGDVALIQAWAAGGFPL